MKVIVQKYGGSSTRSKETRADIYQQILKALNNNYKVVVVVSAMGRYLDPYATDTLYSLVDKNHITNEELDRLVSVGETISSLVIKSEFASYHKNITTIDNLELGILTDDNYQQASVLSTDGRYIKEKLKTYDVVICPGFQGHTKQHKITTLGRNSSDLSAMLLASSIDASEVEIYSDVAGVYTGDPKKIDQVRKLDFINYENMLELTTLGSRILHRDCIELAKKRSINLHIRGTFSNENGTFIVKSNSLPLHIDNEIISITSSNQFNLSTLSHDYLEINSQICHDLCMKKNENVGSVSIVTSNPKHTHEKVMPILKAHRISYRCFIRDCSITYQIDVNLVDDIETLLHKELIERKRYYEKI